MAALQSKEKKKHNQQNDNGPAGEDRGESGRTTNQREEEVANESSN